MSIDALYFSCVEPFPRMSSMVLDKGLAGARGILGENENFASLP